MTPRSASGVHVPYFDLQLVMEMSLRKSKLRCINWAAFEITVTPRRCLRNTDINLQSTGPEPQSRRYSTNALYWACSSQYTAQHHMHSCK